MSTGDEPWYRRRLTAGQHAGLLFLAFIAAGLVSVVTLRHYRQTGAPPANISNLATILLPWATSWLLFADPSRWAPWFGLSAVTASALLSVATSPLSLLLVVALSTIAVVARPRPHRRTMRLCAFAMTAVALGVLLTAP